MVYNRHEKMKKIFAVLMVLVLASGMAFAQDTPTATIQTDGIILYAGVDNPVTVSASGHDAKDLNLVVEKGEGTITKGDVEGKYMVRPMGGQKEIVLRLEYNGKVQLTRGLLVRPIPDPELMFLGKRNGESIRRKDVKAGIPVIVMKNPDFHLNVDTNSMKFIQMTVACGTREEVTLSNKMPNEVEDVCKAADGSKFHISALVQMPDGFVRTLTASFPLIGYPEGGPVIYQPVLDDKGEPVYDKNGNLVEKAFISMEGLDYYRPRILIDEIPNGSIIRKKDITTDSHCGGLDWKINSHTTEMGVALPPSHNPEIKGDCVTILDINVIVGSGKVDLGWTGEFNEEAVDMIRKATRGSKLIVEARVLINGTTMMDLYTFYTLK